MSKRFSAFFLASCMLLAACSTVAPQPSATPVPAPTLTPLPTSTIPVAATETQTPEPLATETPAPSATLDIFAELNPSSAPLAKWNGVPIMPGALSGDGNETSYYFTTQATADAIHAFYDKQLPKIGYTPLAVGNGKGNTVILFYQGSAGMLNLSLFSKGDVILVMMVKSAG